MKHPIEHHYTVSELCASLRFTRAFIYHCIERGELKAVKFMKPKTWQGYEYRIPASSVEAWIKSANPDK